MCPRFSFLAIVAVSLFVPSQLIAGGPPWLVLPIDGVTSANSKACAELLTSKLDDKLWPHAGWERAVIVRERAGQPHITFNMGKDVGLREIEQALAGSSFSIPRDRLRLFGHLVLEIDAREASPKELLAALDSMDYVSVEESKTEGELLLVTLDMPYPEVKSGRDRESVEWEKFQRNDFASDQSTRSESPIAARSLPSYDGFREMIAKHNASLKTVRWDTQYACRPHGGVTVEKDAVVARQKSTVAKDN
jgi:hypothetical protein